jgi:hypothetical protein
MCGGGSSRTTPERTASTAEGHSFVAHRRTRTRSLTSAAGRFAFFELARPVPPEWTHAFFAPESLAPPPTPSLARVSRRRSPPAPPATRFCRSLDDLDGLLGTLFFELASLARTWRRPPPCISRTACAIEAQRT